MEGVTTRIIWHDVIRNVRLHRLDDSIVDVQKWKPRYQFKHVEFAWELTGRKLGLDRKASDQFVR